MATSSLIIGANGTIANALTKRLRTENCNVIKTVRASSSEQDGCITLDLAMEPFKFEMPASVDSVFLLAAITTMNIVNDNPELAERVNVENTMKLAELCRQEGAHLLYVSTNLVLSDAKPWGKISDPTAPQNTYAEQKARVENKLLAKPGASVLRITKIAESLELLLKGWAQDLCQSKPIHPFKDLKCAPISLNHIVEALVALQKGRIDGLHHIGGDEDLGYDQIALMLAQKMGVGTELVQPFFSHEMGVNLTSTPQNTTLDCEESFYRLGMKQVSSRDCLDLTINSILNCRRELVQC